jgi:predicted Fe-S protein YdhL (DUF1289 family)
MDEESGYCLGCRRTIDEIAGWSTYGDNHRQAVLDALPAREVSAAPVAD